MAYPENATMASLGINTWCTKHETSGDLYRRFCKVDNASTSCEPFFTEGSLRVVAGLPGFASGVLTGERIGTVAITMGIWEQVFFHPSSLTIMLKEP